MAVFTVNIPGFGDLPVTPTFAPAVRINRVGNGTVQSVTERWHFEGMLPVGDGEDETDLQTKRNSLLSIFKSAEQSISFRADGSEFEAITPNTHIHGARFQNFDVQAREGGEWVSMLEYSFDVEGTKAIAVGGLESFSKSIETDEEVKSDGSVERTVTVTVNAAGPMSEAFIKTQRPSGARRSRIVVNSEPETAVGTFTIPSSDNRRDGELTVTERITVEPGIFPPDFVASVRSDELTVFHSSLIPTRVSIEGEASTKSDPNKGLLSVPLSGRLMKALSSPPRFSSTARVRKGQRSDRDPNLQEVSYSLEFKFGKQVGPDSILSERAQIPLSKFLSDPKRGALGVVPVN